MRGLALAAPGLALALVLGSPAPGLDPPRLPPALRDIGFEQRIGDLLPSEHRLIDDSGAVVPVGALFTDRPVILAPVYYECPRLCSLVLEGIAKSVRLLDLEAGDDFEILAVSFDPDERPDAARRARATLAQRHDLPREAAGWHFLTGHEDQIRPLMKAIGFRYRYQPETAEWAHAGGIVVLTAEREIARYFYGIDYPSRDLRLALVEAARGQLGSIVDQVLLFCLRYDPQTGRYSATVMTVVRAAGIVTVLGIAGLLLLLRRDDGRAADRPREPGAPG